MSIAAMLELTRQTSNILDGCELPSAPRPSAIGDVRADEQGRLYAACWSAPDVRGQCELVWRRASVYGPSPIRIFAGRCPSCGQPVSLAPARPEAGQESPSGESQQESPSRGTGQESDPLGASPTPDP